MWMADMLRLWMPIHTRKKKPWNSTYSVWIPTAVLHSTLEHNVHRLLAAVHQHKMLRVPYRLLCSKLRTLLGPSLLGFLISVTIGRYSGKFQLPTSTAVLLVVVFSRTWLTPTSWQECLLGQALIQIMAYLLTFWSSRFDSNRDLQGFYIPYMRYRQH